MRSNRGNDSEGTRHAPRGRGLAMLTVAAALAVGVGSAMAAEGTASGTIAYKGQTLTVKHAYLLKGPDVVDKDTIVSRLVLTPKDIGKALAACTTMMCAQGEVEDGFSIDMAAGPRFGYWVGLKGGKVQYSGTTKPAALAATTEQPDRLAGKLGIDDVASGGPRIEVQFDAPLLKEVKAAF